VSLEHCGSWTNGVWEWSLAWRISLFGLEKDQIRQLLETVHDSCSVIDIINGWLWKYVKFQVFSVNYVYKMLRGGF